jgi:hypothetical protein
MEVLPLLILAGLVITVVITTSNYELYNSVFFVFDERPICPSITHKTWFRALVVPFIYIPGLNVIGLLILLYMRAMKALDIN